MEFDQLHIYVKKKKKKKKHLPCSADSARSKHAGQRLGPSVTHRKMPPATMQARVVSRPRSRHRAYCNLARRCKTKKKKKMSRLGREWARRRGVTRADFLLRLSSGCNVSTARFYRSNNVFSLKFVLKSLWHKNRCRNRPTHYCAIFCGATFRFQELFSVVVKGGRAILLVIIGGDLWFNLHQFTHDGAVVFFKNVANECDTED